MRAIRDRRTANWQDVEKSSGMSCDAVSKVADALDLRLAVNRLFRLRRRARLKAEVVADLKRFAQVLGHEPSSGELARHRPHLLPRIFYWFPNGLKEVRLAANFQKLEMRGKWNESKRAS